MWLPECDEDLLDLLKVEPVKQKIYKQKKFSFSRSIQVNKLNSLLVMAALVEYQAKARPNLDPTSTSAMFMNTLITKKT